MTNSRALHIGQVATIVVPVTDQDAALAFYVDTLGMEKVSDLTYPTGERWLEVSPAKGSSNLCLVTSRPERPSGIETGVVLLSSDVLSDLVALRGQGVDVNEQPLSEGDVVWWSGAPLAGSPRSSACATPPGTPSSSSRRPDPRVGMGCTRPVSTNGSCRRSAACHRRILRRTSRPR